MVCYKHTDREAVVTCSECGKGLCDECAKKMTPPICAHCAVAYANEIKATMIKNIILSICLMIAGIIIIKNPLGFLLAGIPYGWAILNRMTPSMFLWLSWVGWIIYFLIKLVLAYAIGVAVMPFKLYKWISELVNANKILNSMES